MPIETRGKTIKSFMQMYGISKFDSISAEGLDSFDVNQEEMVKKSIQSATEIVQTYVNYV